MSDTAAATNLLSTGKWTLAASEPYDIWGTMPDTPSIKPTMTFLNNHSNGVVDLFNEVSVAPSSKMTLSFDVMSTELASGDSYSLRSYIKWNNEILTPLFATKTGEWEHLTFEVGGGATNLLAIHDVATSEIGDTYQFGMKFANMELVDSSKEVEHITEQTDNTQWVASQSTRDVFVIHGNSADYQTSRTQDGKGTVVWKGDHFDILNGIEVLRFDDKDVKATANGQFDIHGQRPWLQGIDTFYYDAAGTQWIEASATQHNIFVINGQKADYGWSKTQDGQGIVVWKGDDFDILHNIATVKFSDGGFDTSTIM